MDDRVPVPEQCSGLFCMAWSKLAFGLRHPAIQRIPRNVKLVPPFTPRRMPNVLHQVQECAGNITATYCTALSSTQL